MQIVTILLLVLILGLLVNKQTVFGAQVEVKEPKFLALLSAAIRQTSYQCPRASIAYFVGPGAKGDVIKVFCGPPSGGTIRAWAYRVTITPDENMLIVPWGK